MECEICGRPIEKGYLTRIEGAVLLLCESCAERGEVIREVRAGEERRKRFSVKKGYVVDDFDRRIREARKRLRMDLKTLSRETRIPLKTLKMIEKGEVYPTEEQAAALEKVLGIELIEEEEVESGPTDVTITLGDVVRIR